MSVWRSASLNPTLFKGQRYSNFRKCKLIYRLLAVGCLRGVTGWEDKGAGKTFRAMDALHLGGRCGLLGACVCHNSPNYTLQISAICSVQGITV